jgi:FtsZ-binding cell division protein ZapB
MQKTLSKFVLAVGLAAVLVGCDRKADTHGADDGHDHGAETSASAPTNRVAIPASVRMNLGITFARVESRNVARTLRVPGRFELLPTARREYRVPFAGRVELLVQQYQSVQPGTPLYRVDASAWRDLHEQLASMQARVDSMTPLREAHRRHEQSLTDKVALWQERIKQLDELRTAGGGSAAQHNEARATLNATQAELADTMEKDAELQAQEKQAQAELRSLVSRRETLIRASHCAEQQTSVESAGGFVVCAAAAGIVETIDITTGGLAAENAEIITTVQPDQVRFRARGLQSDLGRLTDGLAARIVPPQGGSVPLQDAMSGALQIGLTADADERTVDLVVKPEKLSGWARAGVSAHLEITLAGGTEELAIPLSAVVRDGATPIIFRRDPSNPDQVIRLEADVGVSDGRWIVIASGVKEGDEIVVGGNYQLMLATSGNAAKGGHFHPDGTFHEGEDK